MYAGTSLSKVPASACSLPPSSPPLSLLLHPATRLSSSAGWTTTTSLSFQSDNCLFSHSFSFVLYISRVSPCHLRDRFLASDASASPISHGVVFFTAADSIVSRSLFWPLPGDHHTGTFYEYTLFCLAILHMYVEQIVPSAAVSPKLDTTVAEGLEEPWPSRALSDEKRKRPLIRTPLRISDMTIAQ